MRGARYIVLVAAVIGAGVLGAISKRHEITIADVARQFPNWAGQRLGVGAPDRYPEDTAPSKSAGALPSALRTREGVYKKVLVVHSSPLRRSPGGDYLSQPPRPFFDHMFVFRDGPNSREVGSDPTTPLGWIDSASVTRWDTRLALRLTSDVDVFETADDALRAVRGGTATPFARGLARMSAHGRPFPLVESKTVTLNDGRAVVLSRILLVGQEKPLEVVGAKPSGSIVADSARERSELAEVEVRFVVDYTGSMQAAIDAVREQVVTTATTIASGSANARVAFSLLAYRDHDQSSWVTKWLLERGDAAALHRALRRESAAEGGDDPEALLDGLHAALTRPWSVSPRGQRILILVAQTRGHTVGAGNPRGHTFAKMEHTARNDAVVLHGLQVPVRPASAMRQEQHDPELRRQLAQLAGGSGGQSTEFRRADELRAALDREVQQRARVADVRVRVYDGIASGMEADDIARREGIDPNEVRAAFEFIRTSTEIFHRKYAGGDSEAVAAAHGWVVSSLGDSRTTESYVLVGRTELSFVISELLVFAEVAQDPERVVDLVRGSARMQTDGYFARASDESFAGFLASRGVYIHPDSVLFLTQSELISMPESRRRQLRHRLEQEHIPLLISARNSDIWSPQGYGYVPQRAFP